MRLVTLLSPALLDRTYTWHDSHNIIRMNLVSKAKRSRPSQPQRGSLSACVLILKAMCGWVWLARLAYLKRSLDSPKFIVTSAAPPENLCEVPSSSGMERPLVDMYRRVLLLIRGERNTAWYQYTGIWVWYCTVLVIQHASVDRVPGLRDKYHLCQNDIACTIGAFSQLGYIVSSPPRVYVLAH